MKLKPLLFTHALLMFCFTMRITAQDVSEEARHHFDRGIAAAEMAKSPTDYEPAIREFQQAASLAPEWPDVYYNPENGITYGKLYNWHAVNDKRGLAPEGWHIPSDLEWTQLTDYLGGREAAGEKMKSTSGWGLYGNGTNSSGFSALPAGMRNYGLFGHPSYGIGLSGCFWSSSEEIAIGVLSRGLSWTSYVSRDGRYMGNYLSVRCIRGGDPVIVVKNKTTNDDSIYI